MKNKLVYLTHLIFHAPAIFAHPNFHAINFRATSPFSRTINFCAMIFDSFFLLNLLERVIHPRNHRKYIRIAAIASFPGLSCVMDVDYGPYLAGPINFCASKIRHIFSPTNFRAALRENKWCAKFEVSKVSSVRPSKRSTTSFETQHRVTPHGLWSVYNERCCSYHKIVLVKLV